jgi:predicted adenylyl cyclase CyaB
VTVPTRSRNIEVKARIASADLLMPIAAAFADEGPIELWQDDTFFSCAQGRLKLRILSESEGELIFYCRPDVAGPKPSSYIIAPTRSPDILRAVLSLAYGEIGRVRKHRTLFLTGATRIHLDRVEGLGDFLELEVVLKAEESAEAAAAVAKEFLVKLGITDEQLVEEAYVDLISRR